MEFPSGRVFEFFDSDTVKVPEEGGKYAETKLMNTNLALELSLRLPDIGVNSMVPVLGSPSDAVHMESSCGSFSTNSVGYSARKPFSDSQQLSNRSGCSATNNCSVRDRLVGSRSMFLETDWQAAFSDESKNKDVSIGEGLSMDGNEFLEHSEDYLGNSSEQPVKRQINTVERSFMAAVELEEQQLWSIEVEFDDSIIRKIVSEPLKVMAQRLSELSVQETIFLKESARYIIVNPDMQCQLTSCQKAIQSRSDITFEALVKSNRVQLEILLALKTGLQDFLLCNNNLSSSDLGEIFYNMKCRNLACRSFLPVLECYCKFCAQKNGFCSACMCLVCSKFDMEIKTCSWVGCDACLHWCHADCGLRESYFRNERSANGPEGATEMKFHCVACGHSSGMLAYITEVFVNFMEEWTAEVLSTELNYLKRFFCGSEDFRGKKLYDLAIQMLLNLENNADVQEVKCHITHFLTGGLDYFHMDPLIFPTSCEVFDRFMELQVGSLSMEKGNTDGTKLKRLMEKADIDGEKFKGMQLIEHKEEMMKAFNEEKANINWMVLPSETDTLLLLERAKTLLRGNKDSRMMQCLELGNSVKVLDEDRTGNKWASFSSSSSSSVCNYKKRKLC